MDLDEYLNSLRNDLDSQLNRYCDQPAAAAAACAGADTGGSKYCPECGTQLPAQARFCYGCGYNFQQTAPRDEAPAESGGGNNGIIFTNTERLAGKYGESREVARQIIDEFVAGAKEIGQNWLVLDIADYPQVVDSDFWLTYNEELGEFIFSSGLKYGMRLPVFIIGGDDVIPIPMVEDVYGSSDDGRIPCDMCYCFSGNFFSDLWDGDRSIDESHVRNTVSRLPLEDGPMETSIYDDIQCYLDKCNYVTDGLPVGNVTMESHQEWLDASNTMSRHLPLAYEEDCDSESVEEGMYVSPPVYPGDPDTVEPFCQSMASSGMLLFNLHGSDGQGQSGFYSDGEAFNIEMLEHTPARVFNTVACFGARYHGYSRSDSMLLSAIYNYGFLLYAGSLIPVPMLQCSAVDGIEPLPGSGSEHFMPVYCMELFNGLPAGEAMMKAKLEYFKAYRHFERDDFSMATIMMFSLYGNPMLRVQPDSSVAEMAEEINLLPRLPESADSKQICMKSTQRVYTKDNAGSGSLLQQIRAGVDANIAQIHQEMQQHLYDVLGLEPRWLDHIDAFSMPDGHGGYEEGYSYSYVDKSRPYGNRAWVEVDLDGNVKNVMTAK